MSIAENEEKNRKMDKSKSYISKKILYYIKPNKLFATWELFKIAHAKTFDLFITIEIQLYLFS